CCNQPGHWHAARYRARFLFSVSGTDGSVSAKWDPAVCGFCGIVKRVFQWRSQEGRVTGDTCRGAGVLKVEDAWALAVQNIDLKSLQVFAALVQECNVTRVARQLDMTQSAVSHVLARLRQAFDDPLFVPTGHGVAPTDRAQELAVPLQYSIDALQALTRPADT